MHGIVAANWQGCDAPVGAASGGTVSPVISEEATRRAFGGRYRLLELVGEGSDARVYVAEDLTLRRRVALKILWGEPVERPRFLARFAHEMRATSALHHPRVLPVYDWGLDPQPYTVTEYLIGGSLAEIMASGHRLTPSQALVVGLEAARALVNIHAGGRAHLGLSPSSILFDSGGRPYISDLGLAAALIATAPQRDDLGAPDPAVGATEPDANDSRDDAGGVEAVPDAAPVDAGGVEAVPDAGGVEAASDAAPADAVGSGDAVGDAGPSEPEEAGDIDSLESASEDAGDAGRAESEDEGDAEVGSGQQASGAADYPESYSAFEQSQDVRDLALVLCEAVTGDRVLSDADGSTVMSASSLGPLATVLEGAAADDPAERLDASELAQELLRVAGMLPRPEPLPLATHEIPLADPGAAPMNGPGSFEQVGPSVSERSDVPLDDAPKRRWPGIVLAAVVVLGGAAGGVWAWVASGSDTNSVPQLQGQPRAAAATAAADAGWEINEILVREPGTRPGEIVRTEPTAGTGLDEGAALDVYVSLGEPLIRVSDLGGMYGLTVDDAAEELAAVGLDVGDETLVNDEVVPAGNVVGLDLGEGVYELEVGAEVGLLVSDGPAAQ